MTSARSNVELVRIQMRPTRRASPRREADIADHLAEVDVALDRLERLAGALRAWHARAVPAG